MTNNLFVYGSLMSVRVLMHVLKSKEYFIEPQRAQGVLKNYNRYKLYDCYYPAIAECLHSEVHGFVYKNLTNDQIQALDIFEGDEYKRCKVNVILDDQTTIEVDTYVWCQDKAKLYGVWEYDTDFVPYEDQFLKQI